MSDEMPDDRTAYLTGAYAMSRVGFVLCEGEEVVAGPFDELAEAVEKWEHHSLRRQTVDGTIEPVTEEQYLAAGRLLHGPDWEPR